MDAAVHLWTQCSCWECNSRAPTLDSSGVLTGTWLDRGNPVPGLFFLLLLLLLVPPPPLMVLPPDILRFRRLFGACLDGSAAEMGQRERVTDTVHVWVCADICAWCPPTWWRHHPLPFLEEAGLEAVSGAEAVCLVSGHQLLHGLQNHTQLVEGTKRGRVLEITHGLGSLEMLTVYTVHLSIYTVFVFLSCLIQSVHTGGMCSACCRTACYSSAANINRLEQPYCPYEQRDSHRCLFSHRFRISPIVSASGA